MHPTITGEPPVMFGLAARPLPIIRINLNLTTHCYVEGFDNVVGLTLPDLQNRWRGIVRDPQAFLERAIQGAEEVLAELVLDDPDDERERVENELRSFRTYRVLLDHAVANTTRPGPPPLTTEELDAAILALPGVTRVKRHGQYNSIVRVLVDLAAAQPTDDPALAAYHQNEALLHISRLVTIIVTRNEVPERLSIHIEPGDLPDGYELKEGEDCDGESPDAAGVGGCLPTKYWPVYNWELPQLDDAGNRFLEKAQAIDDAWEHFARSEAES